MAVQAEYLLGLDFGKQRDSTVLTIIKVDIRPLPRKSILGTPEYDEEPTRLLTHFCAVWMWRPPLGTNYIKVVDTVAKVVKHRTLMDNYVLLPDATGVGSPIIEMLARRNIVMVPVSSTAGQSPTQMSDRFGYNVPKKDLVDALVVVFQRGLFDYLPNLGHTDEGTGKFVNHVKVFEDELQKFVVKSSPAGRPKYEAEDPVTDHDDTIMSVAMPVWWGMRGESYERRLMRGAERERRISNREEGGWDPLEEYRR